MLCRLREELFLDSRLEKIVDQIKDKSLREKVTALIENPTIEIEGKIYSGMPLEASPAGMTRHHSYPGGFIDTLSLQLRSP